MKSFVSVFGCLIAACGISSAAVSYPVLGSSYTQDFDSLQRSDPNGTDFPWANNDTIPGWYVLQQDLNTSTTTTFTSYRSNNGVGGYGSRLQSFGGVTSSDRALGSQNRNDGFQNIYFGLLLTNDTGGTITGFNLQYAGEQWRRIGNHAADVMTFDYQIFDAGTVTLDEASGWTSVPELAFTSPSTGTTSGNVAGNGAGRVEFDEDISGIDWAPGQQIWLRWTDSSPGDTVANGLRQHGMAIDDVSFTAVPEPSAALLGVFGSLVLLRRRRIGD